jgi:hypothetical protein
MKKLLLPLVTIGLLTASTVPISAETSASVKRAAYTKFILDTLIFSPLVGGVVVGSALVPQWH